MRQDNPYAPPMTAVADIETATPTRTPAPRLWNPGAATSWSLLFSPLFGAILHMKNWQAMGEHDKAATSKTWALAIGIVLAIGIAVSVALPDSGLADLASRLSGFGMLIAWYYAIGKSQRAAILARYGDDYPRRGWSQPLGWAVAAIVALVALIVLIAVAAGLLAGAA